MQSQNRHCKTQFPFLFPELAYEGIIQSHRVIATCQPENPASYRVMEKIGMHREGHFRKFIYRGENLWWDELFYAILDEEWYALNA